MEKDRGLGLRMHPQWPNDRIVNYADRIQTPHMEIPRHAGANGEMRVG